MKQIDFDRAFPQTPDCISTAIELGIRKGKRKMKFRNKAIAAGSIAAVFAILLTAALAMGIKRPAQPDVLTTPPLALPVQPLPMVYSTEGSTYYHMDAGCSGIENASEMSEAEAVQMGKKPCPVCISIACDGHDGEEIEYVYYSQGGLYFHRQEECSDGKMPLKGEYFAVTGAFPGKQPCANCFPEGVEVCLHGRAFIAEPEPTPTPEPAETGKPEKTEYVPLDTKKSSGGQEAGPSIVYTAYGKSHSRYHIIRNCNGGDYRRELTKAQAIQENLDACDACCFKFVFYTEQGRYFHSDAECSGMMNAKSHSRRDARRDGKLPCPICLMVYANEGGLYFHLLEDCMGMLLPDLHTLEEAYAMGNRRCPICLSPEKVYATKLGRYFHAQQDCSGMKGAGATAPEAEWANGKIPCPVCITGQDAQTLKAMFGNNTLGEAAGAAGTAPVRLPEHDDLFTKAFGKGINDLIPGYSYNYTAVQEDPDKGNPLVWMLKSDADRDEDLVQGCFLFGKDEVYDCYWLLVNLNGNLPGENGNNAPAFLNDASVWKDDRDISLFDLQNYALVYSEAKKKNPDVDINRFSISGVKAYFDWEDEPCGYDVRYLYDGYDAYIRRISFGENGMLVNEILKCENWF